MSTDLTFGLRARREEWFTRARAEEREKRKRKEALKKVLASHHHRREFLKIEIWDKIVYYQQRKIGEIIIENDYIVYNFDRETRQLQIKIELWRPDLPEKITPRITREQAQSMAEGIVLFDSLYFISPQSDIFPFRPAPENSYWVIRSVYNQNLLITVIDAITGEKIGYDLPPPYNSFAFSGPVYEHPCRELWSKWAWNATEWFIKSGFSIPILETSDQMIWPDKSEIETRATDPLNMAFYEIAHGGAFRFAGRCHFGLFEWAEASEIREWMALSAPKRLIFLASCDAIIYTWPGGLSYEFREGVTEGTSVIGYYHMASKDCETCWAASLIWQNYFFLLLSVGKTPYEAFLLAHINFPACIKYDGDKTITEKLLFLPLNFPGKMVEAGSLLQREFINFLTWNPNPKNEIKLDGYRIYEIENGN